MKRTEMKTRPRRRSTKQLHLSLAVRSGGWCEMVREGCQGRAVDPCHRIGSKAGGRQGAAAIQHDRLSNVLHGCRGCHDWQAPHRLESERLGWVLREGTDTLATPVLYRGEWRLLDDEGGVSPVDDCDGTGR